MRRRASALPTALLVLILLALPISLDASFAKRGGSSSRRVKKPVKTSSRGFQPPASVPAPKTARVSAPKAARVVGTPLAAGMELMEAGRHEEAGLAFEAIIDAHPDAVEAWSALGLCMSVLGQPDAALACQKQVMRIRGSEQAGGSAAYREAQFESLSAATELPALPARVNRRNV